jgi:hypothetical protein
MECRKAGERGDKRQIRPISVEVVKMPNIGELVVENVSYARSKIVRLVELCLDEGPFHVSTLAEPFIDKAFRPDNKILQ